MVSNGRTEGNQVHLLDLLVGAINGGKPQMRISACITMTGEMLGGSQHPFMSCAANVAAYQRRNLGRVFSKGPRVDDGIGGIGIHVGHREEVPLHPNGPRFPGDDFAEMLSELRLSGRAKSHGRRKDGDPI